MGNTLVENKVNKDYDFLEEFVFRSFQPGDIGWVIHRHGVLYAREYGWNVHFEALVAQIAADFINNYNPERDKCIIVEKNGEIVGSAFIVGESDEVARLRLLLLEPKVRGIGLGTYLVQECISFAKSVGYKKLVLWTQNILEAARHIYKKAGFKKVAEEPHNKFGTELIGETWELNLL
ncbi:MAG TPA: GNAT family N-acetyltransferase [Tissierellaceae bacterium]